MNDFVVEKIGKKPKLKSPILIEGLPGVGNVARVAADFLIDKLKAKKFMVVHSKYFPNSVFINEEKLVELPKMEVYCAKHKKNDIIIVIGDVQPAEETSSYIFSQYLVDLAKEFKTKEIITLGGITARTPVSKPSVFGACTDKRYIPVLKKIGVRFDRKGAVIIVGAAGLMLGLGRLKKIRGFALLSETSPQTTIDLNASKAILTILMKHLGLKFSLKDLNAEIKYIQSGSKKGKRMKKKLMNKLHVPTEPPDLYYIG